MNIESDVYEPGQRPLAMTAATADEKQVYLPDGGIRPVVRMVGPWLQKQPTMPTAGKGAWTLSAGDVELRYATEEHCLVAAKELARRSGEQWLAQVYPSERTVLLMPYEPSIDKQLLDRATLTFLLGA